MRRSWPIWIGFSLCLAVLLAAMGWISLAALRLDRAEADARQQAALEENVRLALWRMDSFLAPLVAQESARPYFSYRTLFPVEWANGRMFNRERGHGKKPAAALSIPPGVPGVKGMGGGSAEMLVPSPLLKKVSPYVLVHFQFEPDGQITSPQVPTRGNFELAVPTHIAEKTVRQAQSRLKQVERLLDRETLLAMLPAGSHDPVEVVLSPLERHPPQATQPLAQRARPQQQRRQPPAQNRQNPGQFLAQADQTNAQSKLNRSRGQNEYDQRQEAVQQSANTAVQNQVFNPLNDLSWMATDVSGVLMTPCWVDGNLLLARRVTAGGRQYVQGCLLDWPAIRKGLLARIADLLPEARLEPVTGPVMPDSEARMLAALPLLLVPGSASPDIDGAVSPIRLSLCVAWACVLLAAGAVGVLLLGVMRLSERRAAFVSAVTHELRTPLTTFRMYSEMLGEGMVPEDQKGHYLDTLQSEASRLAHLVENVLSYARLERGRANGRVEDVSLDRLLAQVESRLADRARQSGMELVVDLGEVPAKTTVRANPSAIEQILFNLVDNACKYAAGARDRRIHLDATQSDGQLRLHVRDHGPGIAPAASRRLFRSFSKSARDAANSAPGIGLGLALSRRLARDMGGRLRLDPDVTQGASFVLSLPVSAKTVHDNSP